jgi:hypothetical protein
VVVRGRKNLNQRGHKAKPREKNAERKNLLGWDKCGQPTAAQLSQGCSRNEIAARDIVQETR